MNQPLQSRKDILNPVKPYFALIIAVFIWGFNYIPIKYALNSLSPFQVAFLSAFIAAILLWITKWRLILGEFAKGNILMLLCTGIFGTFGYNAFVNTALKYTTIINVSILATTTPIFGILFDRIFLKNRLSISKTIGTVIAIFGGIYLVCSGDYHKFLALTLNVGDILALAGVLSFTMFVFFAKKARQECSPITVTSVSLITGVILLSCFAVNSKLIISIKEMSLFAWLSVLYIGIATAIGANLLYTYSLRRISMTTATLFLNAIPLVASLFSVLILGEGLMIIHVISAALIITGISVSIIHQASKSTIRTQKLYEYDIIV